MTAPLRAVKRFPWIYVPTLYFAEGVPYVLVNVVSVVVYKTMDVPNSLIGLTSLLYLPWVIKPLWGPLVDARSTKRRWVVAAQVLMALWFALAARAIGAEAFFPLSIAAFILLAFTSATHDIATDGFYMLALSKEGQALYAGVRGTFYRLAMIASAGGLVVVAGLIQRRSGLVAESWSFVFLLAGAVFIALAAFHDRYLPFPAADAPSRPAAGGGSAFAGAFGSYFSRPGIARIVAFILLYRLGEAMLVKMAQPFLLDDPSAGGLGLPTETVGLAYGTAGTLCLLAGGILGGWLISRLGFRRCILPMALALNVPNLGYVYMAWARPGLAATYALIGIEQFGYGVGFAAFTVYLMYIAREPFKTSHYAISTGLMALGMMAPGAASGYLQEIFGYRAFFVIVCLLTIPGIIAVLFIPREDT
ncbi:MAG: MFS transporter [bacterium]|nr:MFS transporter [bacterium]